MIGAILCTMLLALALQAAVAMPVANRIDRWPSIAGPIFRTQPAPASSPSGGYIAVTETELVPQPDLSQSNDQTSASETDANSLLGYPTSPPQQQLQSTLSVDGVNLPQEIQPPASNETSENTDEYCYQDGEEIEDDYIPFFCCIPIYLLIMLVLLGTLNLKYFCPIMKKDSLESIICSQTSNTQFIMED